MYFMVDQYVDYLAMFINYPAFKAVMESDKDNMGSQDSGFGNFTKVNKDFEEKKNKLLRCISMKTGEDKSIADKMRELKKRITEGEEGFIDVNEKGEEKKES